MYTCTVYYVHFIHVCALLLGIMYSYLNCVHTLKDVSNIFILLYNMHCTYIHVNVYIHYVTCLAHFYIYQSLLPFGILIVNCKLNYNRHTPVVCIIHTCTFMYTFIMLCVCAGICMQINSPDTMKPL